mmetsp:Transcript_28934/g.62940  ORF Transcript_28934/g.62940 Transcript_28934/m.62940 type:complete len:278 (-) Transcript_28934:456-1289(-)
MFRASEGAVFSDAEAVVEPTSLGAKCSETQTEPFEFTRVAGGASVGSLDRCAMRHGPAVRGASTAWLFSEGDMEPTSLGASGSETQIEAFELFLVAACREGLCSPCPTSSTSRVFGSSGQVSLSARVGEVPSLSPGLRRLPRAGLPVKPQQLGQGFWSAISEEAGALLSILSISVAAPPSPSTALLRLRIDRRFTFEDRRTSFTGAFDTLSAPPWDSPEGSTCVGSASGKICCKTYDACVSSGPTTIASPGKRAQAPRPTVQRCCRAQKTAAVATVP